MVDMTDKRVTPAVVRPDVEDKLRQTPGYIEQLEHDAAHPETATAFAWEGATNQEQETPYLPRPPENARRPR
jgi:hypothetical protein